MDKPPTEELPDYLAKGKKAKTKVIFMNGFMVLRIRFFMNGFMVCAYESEVSKCTPVQTMARCTFV